MGIDIKELIHLETAFNHKTLHYLDNKMSEQRSIEVIDLTEIESSQENIETVHDEENVVIEIDDDDENMDQDIEIVEDEAIEIEDDVDHAMLNLTEHFGQHLSESRTCEKCAKIGPFDDKTEEHLGDHKSCQKCESLN